MEENTEAQRIASTTDESTVNAIADELQAQEVSQEQPDVVEQQETTEQQADTQPESREPMSRSERRETNYIDKLSQEIRNSAYQRRDSTEFGQRTDYQPIKYEEGEYEPQQLEQDRKAYGEAQRQAAYNDALTRIDPLQKEMWADRLDLDSERAQKAWDILDESNEKTFDPDFASELNQKYLNFIGYRAKTDANGNIVDVTIDRPNIRYLDFVKAEKQNIERYTQRAIEASRQNITKQAANTGIRPGGQSRNTTHRDVDFNDPNWINKLTREEYDSWGRELSDKWLNERLGIK